MSYNFINEASSIRLSPLCKYDSTRGYASDFSINGNVSGWDYYSGVHTYGCWNGFLFGTAWRSEALIGRTGVFSAVPAEDFYTVRIAMKIAPASGSTPTYGRLMWRTLSNPSWGSDKSTDFDIITDNKWHVYNINLGQEQWWQGDVNDLRLYPIFDASAGDEFYIRSIQIVSDTTYRCTNGSCDYFSSYEHNCPGVGTRGACASAQEFKTYTITEGVNDELIVNINGYGSERVRLKATQNESGDVVARMLTSAISRLDIGGYSEVEVDYIEGFDHFIIYSGTYNANSTVVIENSPAAVELGFFSTSGTDLSVKTTGSIPASGFVPQCSFRLKSFQIGDIFDGNSNTYVDLDPFDYGVEGGRRDYNIAGLGGDSYTNDGTGQHENDYTKVENYGKTLIDISHPFNASGKIKKIYAGCTQVVRDEEGDTVVATGCSIKLFRPRRGGSYEFIEEIAIPDRAGGLYSSSQELVILDCDLSVNKGDVLGLYNVDVYVGNVSTGEPDAQYLQISGDFIGTTTPSTPLGAGTSGFIVYARSDFKQERLRIDIDLGHRYNIDNLIVEGDVFSDDLEFNIARCLDVSWQVDLQNGTHVCGYQNLLNGFNEHFTYPNTAFGLENLSDGEYGVVNGYAGDSASTGANGVTVTNPTYFFVSGDAEWLTTVLFTAWWQAGPYVQDFDEDPVILYLDFPRGSQKLLKSSAVYFKDKENFKAFGISYLSDPLGISGNADDTRYTYVPEYTEVALNGVRYFEGMALYENVNAYLFTNPCESRPELSVPSAFEGPSKVLNFEQYVEANNLAWTQIEHVWEPVLCGGYRLRCDYHKSTKINEVEVFCVTDDVGSSLAGSVNALFSAYEDFWTSADVSELSSTEVELVVGDTPRYLTVEIDPITSVRIRNIKFNISDGSAFVGTKGCEYDLTASHSKVDTINPAKQLKFKNIYGREYDLILNIARDSEKQEGLIFYSKMNNTESINNPVIGPDAIYTKEDDYPLLGQDNNCAINCDCYGLNNLVVDKDFYYSRDDGLTWNYYLTADSSTDLDFSNHNGAKYVIKFIPPSKNRYWRIGFLADAYTLNVKEARFYYQGNLVSGDLYFDSNLDLVFGAATEEAPHLSNSSMTGSYYPVTTDDLITLDLGAQDLIDEIVLFGNSLATFHNSKAGVDDYTKFLIRADNGSIIDASYYNTPILSIGPGVATETLGSYFPGGCISLPGTQDGCITLDNSSKLFNFISNFYSFDMKVKFNTLPAPGDYVEIISSWNGSPVDGVAAVDKCWVWILENVAGTYKLTYKRSSLSYWNGYFQNTWTALYSISGDRFTWYPTTGVWYTLLLTGHLISHKGEGGYDTSQGYLRMFIDGATYFDNYEGGPYYFSNAYDNIVIGRRLDGYMDEVRLSQGGPTGTDIRTCLDGGWRSSTVRTTRHTPLYAFSIYGSDDNAIYGKVVDVDTKYDYVGLQYDVDNSWAATYYSYLAFDLEKRHNIDFIRHYGVASPTNISSWLEYSATDVADVSTAVFDSNISDARWVRVAVPNSSTTYTVNKLGAYPKLTNYIAPGGGYNSSWTSLGSSITAYSAGENLALNATVSGSSVFDNMILSRITDGYIGTLFSECWGSDSSSTQWVSIDLSEIKSIYRIKIFHGYDEEDTAYMNVAYNIQVSTDDSTYTTIFSITGNSSLERTHDLAEAVDARWIKINITSFNSTSIRRRLSTGSYAYFAGAVLREIEIYEYYGFQIVDSEEYPVIAINLKDQFYLEGLGAGGHLIGIDDESTTTDWTESINNTAYSDSVLSDPRKISFTDWGSTNPNLYEQWVVLKQNTATGVGSGADYLKHVIVSAASQQNFCEHATWWASSISNLSEDYSNTVDLVRSLRIDYPTSSGTDIVSLIEGDTFGTDSFASWRDGLGFNLYISDIDKLDTSFGYFYLGNQEIGTEYQWNISSLFANGALSTGWNPLFLRFKGADAHTYEDVVDPTTANPAMISSVELKTLGLVYRGKGSAFTMNLDGFKITRNRFRDYTFFGFGLYLTGEENLTATLGQFDITRGTVEFFLRPDYSSSSADAFSDLKQRNLFCFINNANDMLGAYVANSDIGFYFGNLNNTPQVLTIDASDFWVVDQTVHLAFVFSNDGSGTDDGHTMKVFLNNQVVGAVNFPWVVEDNRAFNFTLGGYAPYVIRTITGAESTSINGVVSNLKIHNYCKLDFNDSLENEEVGIAELITPSQLVELSKDNLTFYDVESGELPLVYEKVPDGNTVVAYVRINIPKGLTGQEKRTAGIIASWDIGV